jgi:O-acetyl-ADP-ribose deacetylase (regulator of RNase III)
MKFIVNGLNVKLVQGDITDLTTDAITNAANSALILGGGVAGAIADKGGPSIQEECLKIGHCDVGKAVITGGGSLKARYVIHAVGPRMGEGDEHAKLASAVRSVLELAEQKKLGSVALPAISTGIFGFPMADCAQITAKQIIDYSFEKRAHLHQVVVCLYDKPAYQIFTQKFLVALSEIEDESKNGTLLLDADDQPKREE